MEFLFEKCRFIKIQISLKQMSNPTEQPIDPDKMITWCDVCKIEIIGINDWQIHLDSQIHKSRLEE